jgi:Zn-dependent protease with chaperone function
MLPAAFLFVFLALLPYLAGFYVVIWALAGLLIAAPVVLPVIYSRLISRPLPPASYPELRVSDYEDFDSVRIVESNEIEAYTTWLPSKTLLISRGAIEELDSGEFEALVAHERGHLALNHVSLLVLIRTVWLTVWTVALTSYLSSWSPTAVCAAAFVVVSTTTLSKAWLRLSEFHADRYAAEATSKEDYYATLSKLESSPWSLSLRERLLSNHPPIRDRVRYLEQS